MRRFVLVVVAMAVCGCGKTVSEDDCRKIADKLREVWQAEAKKVQPADGAPPEKVAALVRAEEERLASSWSAECKKELMGRRADPKQIDCLMRAKSIEQVNKCSEL